MASTDNDNPDLGILLILALRGFVDELHSGLDKAGFDDVRPPYGVVFRALKDRPLTLTALAAQLGVTKQATVKIVDEMESRGLLSRVADDTDRRAKQLVLTDRGHEAMQTAIRLGRTIEQRLLAETGPRTLASMRRALETFVGMTGGADDMRRHRSRAVW